MPPCGCRGLMRPNDQERCAKSERKAQPARTGRPGLRGAYAVRVVVCQRWQYASARGYVLPSCF